MAEVEYEAVYWRYLMRPENRRYLMRHVFGLDVMRRPKMGERRILRILEGNRLGFFCIGCAEMHQVTVPPAPHAWGFNDDYNKPTFTPSIKVGGIVPLTNDEHARLMAGEKIETKERICHSFVENGQIRFLSDCTHALAGHTVDMVPF